MRIRNDQYLHRLTAGRGAIKPDDPLEVRLYGPGGQPIGVQNDALKVSLQGSTVDMATETTLAQSVDKLNSILSRLESKLDTAIFDSQGNPISAANRLPVEATLLYGPDGNPISDTNKLPVRVADLETLVGTLNDSAVTNPANAASVIAALKGLLSVVGKEATLGQILSALAPLATESTLLSLASAVAKETTLAQVLSALGALATETTLGGVKTAVDVLAGTVDTQAGVQKVALSGSLAENLATKSYESRVYTRSGTIAAGTTEILIDIVGRECHLESLAMGVDHDGDVLIRIWPYRADGTVDPNRLMVPTHTGNAVGDVNPAILQNHWSGENDFFKVFKFDQQNGRYTIGMKRQTVFANGIRVAIVNTNTTTARTCGVVAMISQWRA